MLCKCKDCPNYVWLGCYLMGYMVDEEELSECSYFDGDDIETKRKELEKVLRRMF